MKWKDYRGEQEKGRCWTRHEGDKWEACWMWREGEWEAWVWDKPPLPAQERNKTLRKTSGLRGKMSLFVGMWRVRCLWDVQMEMFSGQPNILVGDWGSGESLAGDSVGSHPCVGDGGSYGCEWGHSWRWRGYGIGRAGGWALRIPWFKGEQRKGALVRFWGGPAGGFVSGVDWYCRKGPAREWLSSVITLNIKEDPMGSSAKAFRLLDGDIMDVERQDLGE